MNEILQKRIEEASIDYTMRTKPVCIAGDAFADMARELNKNPAFIEGANYALQNQWISVEEDLPPYDKDVFVRFVSRFQNNPNEYEVGYCTRCRTKDETVLTDKKGFSIIGNMEIKHWMPIPEMKVGEE